MVSTCISSRMSQSSAARRSFLAFSFASISSHARLAWASFSLSTSSIRFSSASTS